MAVARRNLTLEEFLALPEEKPALEYLQGAVTQKMSPMPHHGRLQFVLARHCEDLAQPPGSASAFTETRVTFGRASFVPDVVVYRADRVPADEHGDIALDFYDPPDVAIEILSPGQSGREQVERCRWYVRNGVRASLFVNSRTRTVRIFRPDRESGLLSGSDRVDLGDVLPGFALTADEIFNALRARPA